MLTRVATSQTAGKIGDTVASWFMLGFGISMADVNGFLAAVSFIVTISFTIWRWRKAARRKV